MRIALVLGSLLLAALAIAPARAQAQPGADDPAGEFAAAQRYENGEGVPRDDRRAIALYCAAARQGHVDAPFNLGWMYLNGRGVVRDDANAAAWLRLAAARGNPQAPQVLALLGPEPVHAPAGCPPPPQPTARLVAPQAIARLVATTAARYDLDPKLVLAVIAIESDFQADAVSPRQARGLMQLLPATAQRFGVRHVFDPAENIRGGVRYLHWLLGYFNGDLALALAAYNAGAGAVLRYGGVPPYAETETYLRRIAVFYPLPAR